MIRRSPSGKRRGEKEGVSCLVVFRGEWLALEATPGKKGELRRPTCFERRIPGTYFFASLTALAYFAGVLLKSLMQDLQQR